MLVGICTQIKIGKVFTGMSFLYFFTLLCVVLHMPISSCDAANQTPQFQQISYRDKDNLSLFFESLIRLEGFGYTIFGNKPVSQAGCWKASKVNDSHVDKLYIYKNGQALLEKYSHIIKSDNFLFKFENTDSWYGIFLINKDAFLGAVNKNIELFKQVLGDTITAEIIFSKLKNSTISYSEIFNNDESLLGILFGYGTKNAMMYKRKNELAEFLKCETLDSNKEQMQKYLVEHAYINKILKPSTQGAEIVDLFPDVGFYCDSNDEETIAIINHYKEIQPIIAQVFLQNNIVEAVLCKFNEK